MLDLLNRLWGDSRQFPSVRRSRKSFRKALTSCNTGTRNESAGQLAKLKRKIEMPVKERSPYQGGVGVVEFHMRTRLFRQLTQMQAFALWLEVKDLLEKWDMHSTVQECEEAKGGSLDTFPRGDVLDALAKAMTGCSWPANCSPKAESETFLDKLREAFTSRGYVRAQEA